MSLTGISANRLELLQIANAVAMEKSIDKDDFSSGCLELIHQFGSAHEAYRAQSELLCKRNDAASHTGIAGVLDDPVVLAEFDILG